MSHRFHFIELTNESQETDVGYSIYYTASRPKALSTKERQVIETLVGKYSLKEQADEIIPTGAGRKGEDFCLYESPLRSSDDVLEGSTRLPDDSEEAIWSAIQHWCQLLTELRRSLPDAIWHVHVDDHDIYWVDERQEYDPSA